MAAVSGGKRATEEDVAAVKRLFAAAGDVVDAEEGLLDLVTGVSGSGPGYVFAFMEALEDPDKPAVIYFREFGENQHHRRLLIV